MATPVVDEAPAFEVAPEVATEAESPGAGRDEDAGVSPREHARIDNASTDSAHAHPQRHPFTAS
jgi:hypothetical protein